MRKSLLAAVIALGACSGTASVDGTTPTRTTVDDYCQRAWQEQVYEAGRSDSYHVTPYYEALSECALSFRAMSESERRMHLQALWV